MSNEALKFFHNFIKEMIQIGGANLPKTVSSRLGTKLAQVYKEKGIVSITDALKESYEAIKGWTSVDREDDSIQVSIKFLKKTCPLGGKYDPDKAGLIQDSICVPYMEAFLKEIDPENEYEEEIEQCIVADNKRTCRYILTLKSLD